MGGIRPSVRENANLWAKEAPICDLRGGWDDATGRGMLTRVDKFCVVTFVQGRVFNPLVKATLRRVPVPGWSLLETTGRKTGLKRTTPVGDGLEGSTFWIVA